MFTSDDDALAAATDAYKNYVAVIDEIARDGGKSPDRLRHYTNAEGLKYERQEAKRLQDTGAHLVGATLVRKTSFQQRFEDVVIIYACQDLANVDMVDADGNSLVPSDRADRLPRQVTLERTESGRLVVSSDKDVSASEICD